MNTPSNVSHPPGRRWPRRLAVASALIVFIVFNVVLFAHRAANPFDFGGPPPPDFSKVAPDIDQRIEQTQIKPLQSESLEQSIANLSDVGMYYWPGAPGEDTQLWTSSGFPLQPKIGLRDVSSVTSNRRFVKAYESLGKLPKAEAARAVSKAIGDAAPVYRKLYDADFAARLEERRRPPPGNAPFRVSMLYQTSSNEDGTPTILGERCSVETYP